MRIKSFLSQCVRVFKITRKPNKAEYRMIVKMSGLGIGIIGTIGFLVTFVKELIFN